MRSHESSRRSDTPATGESAALRKRRLAGLSVAHFVADGYFGFPSPLLSLLSPKLGVSYAAASALLGVNSASSAVGNLVVGLGSGRYPRAGKVIVLGGAAGTVLLMSAVGVISNYWVLMLVLGLGAFCCGAFHPPAFAAAGEVSRPHRQLGLSVLMTTGIAAIGLGPALVSQVVKWRGLGATPLCAIPGLILLAAAAFLGRGRTSAPAPMPEKREHHMAGAPAGKARLWLASLFANAGLRTFSHMGILVIISYLMEKRWNLSVASSGWGVAALQVGAGAGGLLAGQLTHIGEERRTILWCLPVNMAVLIPMAFTSGRIWFLWLFAYGLLSNAPQPLVVSLAQHIAPVRSALMSGLIVGPVYAVAAALASVTAPVLIARLGQAQTMAIFALPLALSWLTAWLLPERNAQEFAKN